MADEIDDQAAMAQWASQNPPGAFGEGGDAGGGNEFGDFSGGMGGWAYGSTLMPSDRSVFRQTANTSLASSPKGQVVSWVNPETRVAGTITPGDNFTGRGGARCREFEVSVAAPEGVGRGGGTACRTEAGEWQLYNSPV